MIGPLLLLAVISAGPAHASSETAHPSDATKAAPASQPAAPDSDSQMFDGEEPAVDNGPGPSPAKAPSDAPPNKPSESKSSGKKPKLTGAAPVITITSPRTVDMPHMVTVTIEPSGGPIREQEMTITPQPAKGDLVYGFKEITDGNGDVTRVEDRNKFSFVGEPGVYSIEVLAIGLERGYCRQEARILIRDPGPAKVAKEPAGPQTPKELLRKWVQDVHSPNVKTEALEIAKAAHEAAREIRDGRADPAKPVEAWQLAAYMSPQLGKAYANWNQNPNGRSFFSQAGDFFADGAAHTEGFSPSKILDYFGDVLEGKDKQ